ncbi:MAG: M23 family metallopeptidase [Bacilli bacterium]|nr:M23 family metallopeptidase [Bacilli bacterium]
MKKRLVLKPFVVPMLYTILIVLTIMIAVKLTYKEKPKEDTTLYVSEEPILETTPVVNDEVYVLNPYSGDDIKIKINYYNENDSNETQEGSIIKYESTYLQNSGLTYESDNRFNVVAIIDGEVTKIYSNEMLGNVIEVTHDNGIKSIYQTVSNIKVSEGQIVHAGDVIAESGTSKIFENGNYLYFEVIKDGSLIDPNRVIGQNINNI